MTYRIECVVTTEYAILTSIGEHMRTECKIDGAEGIVVCSVVALEDERQIVGGVGGRGPADRQPLAVVA